MSTTKTSRHEKHDEKHAEESQPLPREDPMPAVMSTLAKRPERKPSVVKEPVATQHVKTVVVDYRGVQHRVAIKRVLEPSFVVEGLTLKLTDELLVVPPLPGEDPMVTLARGAVIEHVDDQLGPSTSKDAASLYVDDELEIADLLKTGSPRLNRRKNEHGQWEWNPGPKVKT